LVIRVDPDSTGHRDTDGSWVWTLESGDGSPERVLRHRHPDASGHPYLPFAPEAPIALYRGAFTLDPQDPPTDAYDGVVLLTWVPTPAVEVSGERTTTVAAVQAFLDAFNNAPSTLWAAPPIPYLIDGSGTPWATSVVPPSPPGEAASWPWSGAQGTAYLAPIMVGHCEFGTGDHLTHLGGLLPNGWDATDGGMIAHPGDRRSLRRGRTRAQGGGWQLDLDELTWPIEPWPALNRRAGYGITHAIDLRRDDGAAFSAAEADAALSALRTALAVGLGRRTGVALPVGWDNTGHVWTRWSVSRVDPYRDRRTWLDASVSSAQMAELIGHVLTNWANALRRDTLSRGAAYLVQALDSDAETGIANAVSGLTLIGDALLRQELQLHTRRAWKETADRPVAGGGNTQWQIRQLLTRSRIDTSVPAAFVNLATAQQQINSADAAVQRDGLGTVIKMRNSSVHPTAGTASWSGAAWAEARELMVHYLELALLAYVDYKGKIKPRTAPRPSGAPEDVPWL
jgi:hypothetical protein